MQPGTRPAASSADRAARVLIVQEVARRGGSLPGILLALQLFDLGPCEVCGYVHDRCRCAARAPRGDEEVSCATPG